MRRCFLAHAFPPDIAVIGKADVGEDGVALQRAHAIGIGRRIGTRCNAEITRFRIDRIQAPVGTRLDPCNIVADGSDFPALESGRWNQHSKVGLAAG